MMVTEEKTKIPGKTESKEMVTEEKTRYQVRHSQRRC